MIKIEGLNREQEAEFKARFEEKAILSFKREEEVSSKAVSIEEHKLSVAELGQKLLRQNLSQSGLDEKLWEQVFEMFAEGKPEKVQQLLNQKLNQKENSRFSLEKKTPLFLHRA